MDDDFDSGAGAGAGFGDGHGVPTLTVSEFLSAINQTLEYAYSEIIIEGEVASFKVNQGKWVFFDLKDEESSVSCFLPLFQLRMPLEDGMKVRIKGAPKVTKWGKFSVTVRQIMPVGEGNIKKSLEILKKKLSAEGLFDVSRKREIPKNPPKIGVISSTHAAGYADFCKIINARWGGLEIQTAHTQVQGLDAPDQIIRALKYFNERAEVDVIAIMRGGGSADDLAAFNDEKLVREIAASRIPVITGIGHEVDESLADLAADVRASTPSNVAELLTSDKRAESARLDQIVAGAKSQIKQEILRFKNVAITQISEISRAVKMQVKNAADAVDAKIKIIEAMNPEQVLKHGYAIIDGDLEKDNVVKITTFDREASAKIIDVKNHRKGTK